jgi:hypothetical protein
VESSIIQATVVCENLLDAEVAAKLCFMNNGLDPEFKKTASVYSTIFVGKSGKITVNQ